MKVINLSASDSILNSFLAELRDVNVQNDRMRFRQNVVRIGHIEAYEISKFLSYSSKTIQTPLERCEVSTCDDDIVLGTVFRAGLPLHESFLDIFDKAGNAFVSAFRYYTDQEMQEVGIKVEYCASPSLDGKTLILVDPMLATGGSAAAAITMLKEKGAKKLILMCLVAAPEGVKVINDEHPDVPVYVAAVDEKLNEHGYIVPGLGDAGDRIFGTL